MFFLNKRSNFEEKPHELSYRSNICSGVCGILRGVDEQVCIGRKVVKKRGILKVK